MNYKGYFKSLDNISYEVRLIADTGTTYTEIYLAGDNPFVVSYNKSESPFDPVRTSTATISIVRDDYLIDLLTPYAQSVRVQLYNSTTSSIVWEGFLTPKLYDQSYVDEWETIELEAADCISSLQYVDYTDNTAYTPSIVTFKSIIDKICTSCKNLDGYYWTRSKKLGTTVMLPSHLSISEYNFLSTDTQEWWKMDEMLEEICRYLGFTCLQWGNKMYFLDYRYLSQNNDFYATYYSKASNYTEGSASHIGGLVTAVSGDVRSNDATISFKPIYNKCVVNCNMNFVEDFIPNPFDDVYLTNRNGDFYENYEVIAPVPTAKYPDGTKWFQQNYTEDKQKQDDDTYLTDADYRYFHRLYDHQYWESVYRDTSYNVVTPTSLTTSAVTTDYIGGTIVDLGTVRKKYMSQYGQYIVPNKLDYDRYLCISEKSKAKFGAGYDKSVFKLKDGFHSTCMLSSNGFLVINFSVIFERYAGRPYICPIWQDNKMSVGGGTSRSQMRTDGFPYFKLKIGDKYWTGLQWSTTNSIFPIAVEFTDDNIGYWNAEKTTLNNVSWDEYVNEEGYKIPLSGVDTTQEISFEVVMPSAQYERRINDGDWDLSYNEYCWIKSLTIKAVEAGQDIEKEESDIVYENVIDADAVNTLSDITCRITTHCDLTEPSYSNVIYNGALLTAMTEPALSNTAQKPEENIVEKYVSQYSANTKQINITLDMDYTPLNKVIGLDVDYPNKPFVNLGAEINYQMGQNTITFEEIK